MTPTRRPSLKIEPRGKYAGVKVHLDANQVREFIKLYEHYQGVYKLDEEPLYIAVQVGKALRKLVGRDPSILEDKTPDQVAAVLEHEAEKAANKLKALKSGDAWQDVH